MNVLYVWDADYPWDVRVEKICRTLADNGCDVHLAARNLRKAPEWELVDKVTVHRLRPYKNDRLNYAISFPVFCNPVWRTFLDGLVSKNGIDVILVRDLPMAMAGIQVGKRHHLPVVFDMAEDYVAMISDIWRARRFKGLNLLVRNPHLARLVERYTFARADHVLVVVDEARDFVLKKGVGQERISIVGNTPVLETLNTCEHSSTHGLSAIRERYSAIYTGGVQMGRGIQVVIEAIPFIVGKIPDFLFVVVGDGYALPELKAVALEKRVQNHVMWTGSVDHERVFAYVKACKVGLIPHCVSDHVNRTMPNKLFDYMGLGLPVIASDAIPLKRVIDQEECGMTFRSRDAEDLAGAMIRMHSSKNDYGENGRRAVLTRYNWAEDSKRLMSAIDRVFSHS